MTDGRVIRYVATSVDGYVATGDGGVEWLDGVETDADGASGYEAFFADVDCLVMGANTYEQVLTFGAWPYEDRPTYVFTHRELARATDAVTVVEGDVAGLVADLKREHDRIWLVGGAALARTFLREGQVDELRLNVVPVLLGSGIALFGETGERRSVRHVGATTHGSGIVELRYRVP
jgi:dihydrofolate reductase